MVQTIFAGAADADERPGNMLKIDRKIFATEMQIGVMGAVPSLAATSLAKSAQRASIDQRRRAGIPEDVNLCAKGAGETGRDLADPGLDPLLHFTVCECAASLPARRSPAARSRVLPPGSARHAEHHRVEGVHFPDWPRSAAPSPVGWPAGSHPFLHVGGRHAPFPVTLKTKRSTLA